MGTRYTFNTNCAYCKELNGSVYFAPTCGIFTFKCKKCKKENFITSDFKIKKMDKINYKDIYKAVKDNAIEMNKKQIEEYSSEVFNNMGIKK